MVCALRRQRSLIFWESAGHLIAEADDTGATLREYVWLDDLPLAVVADVDTMSPNLYFVHADHLDRPVKMTDGGKAVVWDAIYRPFGEAHAITGSAANNLRFPGQYFLIEAGLHYNWHRHYDPTLGRYTQPDPLEFVDGPSIYSYALSSPAMEVDAEGLSSGYMTRLILHYYRYYKAMREGAMRGEEFFRHLKGIRDAQRRIDQLEKMCEGAKGNKAKELQELLKSEKFDMKGHWKEMWQKWPEFMRDFTT